MSCIAGIINLNGAPVDRGILDQMLRVMEPRAPDQSNLWVSGHVGLGHALLETSRMSRNLNQPMTLDGDIWITADARLDGKKELIELLKRKGIYIPADCTSQELILYAYKSFGDSIVNVLVGDFAFAIWDFNAKKLVCATDHFGVRPIFYAKNDHVFVFASDLDALLCHPSVSRDYDDIAVGDFLLFGNYLDESRTIRREIHRLPSSTYITVENTGISQKRYWRPSSDGEVSFSSESELIDQFSFYFEQAATDRVDGDFAMELSGGLDSTSIGAMAIPYAFGKDYRAMAICRTCHDFIPDDCESNYSEMVASALGVPLTLQSVSGYSPMSNCQKILTLSAEPLANPDQEMFFDAHRLVINKGFKVLLTGVWGDALFGGRSSYRLNKVNRERWPRLFSELYHFLRVRKSLSGMGLRNNFFKASSALPLFPKWLDSDFCEAIDLHSRWSRGWDLYGSATDSFDQLSRPWLSQSLGLYEALKLPVVARHPFLDVRLVSFVLALPHWMMYDKRILRESMLGKLPEAVRRRPKTGLAGDHIRGRVFQSLGGREINLSRSVQRFVNLSGYSDAFKAYLAGEGGEATWASWMIFLPLMLECWFSSRELH